VAIGGPAHARVVASPQGALGVLHGGGHRQWQAGSFDPPATGADGVLGAFERQQVGEVWVARAAPSDLRHHVVVEVSRSVCAPRAMMSRSLSSGISYS
jgi:hypothetical protein